MKSLKLTVRLRWCVRQYQVCEKCGSVRHMPVQCPVRDQKYQQACYSCGIAFVFERMIHTSNYGKSGFVFRHCNYLSFQQWTQKRKNDVIFEMVLLWCHGSFAAQVDVQETFNASKLQTIQA